MDATIAAEAFEEIFETFGQSVTLQPKAGGPSVPGLAIFHEAGTVLIGGVVSPDEALSYQASTFPTVVRGDTFVLSRGTFTAREPHQPRANGLEFIVPLARA